jgi:hypothetical protein
VSLNSLILSTLAPIKDVSFRVYKGSSTTYVTFFEVIDVPKLHADDELKKTETTIQVDVWSKGNFIPLVTQVKQLMKDAGFSYGGGRDFYETDTKLYHYALTYRYSVDIS